MKLFRMIIRSFRDAFKSVVRNFSLSLASVSCITITLIIVAFSILISENVKNFTDLIEKDVTIVAYVKNEATKEDVKKVEESINGLSNIESVKYKSKTSVKKDIEKSSDTFDAILSEWSEEDNPLQDTFMIKVKNIDRIKTTAREIENIDLVTSTQYGEGMVEKLVGAFDAIKKLTVIAAIALVVVTLFLIINTIKLTIFSRKREISIMRLVGANNTRIKLPFIVEGMVLGLIGSIIPILLIIYGYTSMYDHFKGQLFSPLIKLIKPTPFIFNTSIIVLVIGVIVGMIGSSRAVRRYIKV